MYEEDVVHIYNGISRACFIAKSGLTLCDPTDGSLPLSMGFSRQEYRSGLSFPSAGDLPDPGIESSLLGGRQIIADSPRKPTMDIAQP